MANSVYRLSDSDLLTLAAQIISNSRGSAVIREAVAPYGYDERAFAEADVLFDAYDRAVYRKRDLYGRKCQATQAVNDTRDALHRTTLMPHVTITRVIFKDERATLHRLGLTGRRERTFDGWLHQARRFYRVLLADEALLRRTTARGITLKQLQDALGMLDELETMRDRQQRLKAQAQDATRRRNDARRALTDWLSAYQTFARVALRDRPDLTEQFGLVARSA